MTAFEDFKNFGFSCRYVIEDNDNLIYTTDDEIHALKHALYVGAEKFYDDISDTYIMVKYYWEVTFQDINGNKDVCYIYTVSRESAILWFKHLHLKTDKIIAIKNVTEK